MQWCAARCHCLNQRCVTNAVSQLFTAFSLMLRVKLTKTASCVPIAGQCAPALQPCNQLSEVSCGAHEPES
jgi:hypothetical protein